MKFSKHCVQLKSFSSYIGFSSSAATGIGYEIRAREVKVARVSGSFTWTPLDELLELASIPEVLEIFDTISM